VDLGLVEEQEESAEAADAIVRIPAVQLRAVPALGLELREPCVGALPQLLERAELDRLRRAGLRAGRLVPALQPVVAERALPDPAVLLAAEERRQIRLVARARRPVGGDVPLVEHAERAGRHAVA